MKKVLAILAVIISIFASVSVMAIAAGDGYTSEVNGISYEYTVPSPAINVILRQSHVNRTREVSFDQPPVIIEGRTLVPMRAIFESLSMAVTWDDSTKTVTAAGGQTTVIITVGDDRLYRNTFNRGNAAYELDIPAVIINGRTLVPLRAIGDALGGDVVWEEYSHTVTIFDYKI